MMALFQVTPGLSWTFIHAPTSAISIQIPLVGPGAPFGVWCLLSRTTGDFLSVIILFTFRSQVIHTEQVSLSGESFTVKANLKEAPVSKEMVILRSEVHLGDQSKYLVSYAPLGKSGLDV